MDEMGGPRFAREAERRVLLSEFNVQNLANTAWAFALALYADQKTWLLASNCAGPTLVRLIHPEGGGQTKAYRKFQV